MKNKMVTLLITAIAPMATSPPVARRARLANTETRLAATCMAKGEMPMDRICPTALAFRRIRRGLSFRLLPVPAK